MVVSGLVLKLIWFLSLSSIFQLHKPFYVGFLERMLWKLRCEKAFFGGCVDFWRFRYLIDSVVFAFVG